MPVPRFRYYIRLAGRIIAIVSLSLGAALVGMAVWTMARSWF
jgi:hypothetical protein